MREPLATERSRPVYAGWQFEQTSSDWPAPVECVSITVPQDEQVNVARVSSGWIVLFIGDSSLVAYSSKRLEPCVYSGRTTLVASAARAIEQLQEFVRCEFDIFVAPLGRAIHTGDQAVAVHASEVPVDECVPRLRLV